MLGLAKPKPTLHRAFRAYEIWSFFDFHTLLPTKTPDDCDSVELDCSSWCSNAAAAENEEECETIKTVNMLSMQADISEVFWTPTVLSLQTATVSTHWF